MKLSFTALAIGLTLSGSILSADSRPEPLADPCLLYTSDAADE